MFNPFLPVPCYMRIYLKVVCAEYPCNWFSVCVHFILTFKFLRAIVFLLQGHPEIVSQLVDLIGITSIMEVSFEDKFNCILPSICGSDSKRSPGPH
jgi:hypothetical protein